MEKLKQNTLDSGTTDISFVKTINSNSDDKISFVKEVELEDGIKVNVESITPHKMKSILNRGKNVISFKTPGENYNDNIKGICQLYNDNLDKYKDFVIEVGKTYKFKCKDSASEVLNNIFIDYLETQNTHDSNIFINNKYILQGIPIISDTNLNNLIGCDLYTQFSEESIFMINKINGIVYNCMPNPELFGLTEMGISEEGWYITSNGTYTKVESTMPECILQINQINIMYTDADKPELKDSYTLGNWADIIEYIEEI